MRLRNEVIGALNLFRAAPEPLSQADLRVGQALADVATIGLLQERAVRRMETVAEQLQSCPEQPGRRRASQRQARRAPQRRHGRGLRAPARPCPRQQPAAHRRCPTTWPRARPLISGARAARPPGTTCSPTTRTRTATPVELFTPARRDARRQQGLLGAAPVARDRTRCSPPDVGGGPGHGRPLGPGRPGACWTTDLRHPGLVTSPG